mgnify:CR=1 FL=1
MSITREQLKVGETYNCDGDLDFKRKILAIGETELFYLETYKEKRREDIEDVDNFLKHHSIVKPESKKIGEVAWFMWKDDGEIEGVMVDGLFFKKYINHSKWQRVTIKDNEIWEFYE